MNHSVKSKTIRHDCHLLVRAEQNHLKTLVFLLQLFKLNRHKLDFIRVEELFFLLGFAKIIVQNRLLFSIKPKNVRNLLAGDTVLLLKFQNYPAPITTSLGILHFKELTNMSMGKQLTPHPHASTPHGHKAANPQHSPLGPAGPLAFPNTLTGASHLLRQRLH